MKALFTNRIANLLIGFFFLVLSNNVFGQCPAAPATCKYTVGTGDSLTNNFTVRAGETLCILSGTFTGSVNIQTSTSRVYVYPGANFNPNSITQMFGTLINCGTALLPGFNFDNNSFRARVENYGTMVLAGSYGSNNNNYWYNGFKARMTFNSGLTLNNTQFTNDGNILISGGFTINSGTNVFVNHDSLTTTGAISLNAAINNDAACG